MGLFVYMSLFLLHADYWIDLKTLSRWWSHIIVVVAVWNLNMMQ